MVATNKAIVSEKIRMLQKIFFVGIFFSFVLGQFARFQFWQGAAFTLLDFVVVFFLVGNIVTLIFSRRKIDLFHHELSKPVFIFGFACVLSLLVNIPSLGAGD